MPMTTLQSTPQLPGLGRIASIRTKFVVFFSLILILTSSALSWYFIEVKTRFDDREPQSIGHDSPHQRGE